MTITAYQHGLAKLGYAPDVEAALLPAQAWTGGVNMRFINDSLKVAPGDLSKLSATTSLISLFNVATTTSNYWALATTAALYATDGTSFADITRLSATTTTIPYTGTADSGWSMEAFGNFCVFANGADATQVWVPGLTNNAYSMTAWPSTWVAGVVRAYHNYLVALDISISGNRYPSLVAWSDAASYDALPTSWTPATTNDAGDNNLNDTPGWCIDALPLAGSLIIYKDDSVWAMTFTGGAEVMAFRKLFANVGLLTRRCVQQIQGRHFFVGKGDVWMHDGVQLQSVASGRVRDELFNAISSDSYARVFTVHDAANEEVWVCYPDGSSYPNRALIYNYKADVWSPPRTITETGHIASGIVNFGSNATFDSLSGTFDEQVNPFDSRAYNPSQIRLLSCDTLGTDLLEMNNGYEMDGTPYTAYIERALVPFDGGADATQQAIIWSPVVKVVRRVYVDATGTGTVRVYVGSQDSPEGGATWYGPFNLTVGSETFVWTFVRGRYLSIKFVADSTTDQWTLLGYKLDWEPAGER